MTEIGIIIIMKEIILVTIITGADLVELAQFDDPGRFSLVLAENRPTLA